MVYQSVTSGSWSISVSIVDSDFDQLEAPVYVDKVDAHGLGSGYGHIVRHYGNREKICLQVARQFGSLKFKKWSHEKVDVLFTSGTNEKVCITIDEDMMIYAIYH